MVDVGFRVRGECVSSQYLDLLETDQGTGRNCESGKLRPTPTSVSRLLTSSGGVNGFPV